MENRTITRIISFFRPFYFGTLQHYYDNNDITSNNQRLEKCFRCVLLLYNWDLRVCFVVVFLADHLAPVVQRVASAIRWINHYPADKCYQN